MPVFRHAHHPGRGAGLLGLLHTEEWSGVILSGYDRHGGMYHSM